MAELSVVRNILGNVAAGIKSLMAHQHTPPERAPSQALRGRKAAMTHKVVLRVNDVGIAIDYSRPFLAIAHTGADLVERIIRSQGVASIKEQDIVACGTLQPFVHREIYPAVRLREYFHLMTIVRSIVMTLIFLSYMDSLVLRRAINYPVFDIIVSLSEHRLQCRSEDFLRIICYRYNCYFHPFVFNLSYPFITFWFFSLNSSLFVLHSSLKYCIPSEPGHQDKHRYTSLPRHARNTQAEPSIPIAPTATCCVMGREPRRFP